MNVSSTPHLEFYPIVVKLCLHGATICHYNSVNKCMDPLVEVHGDVENILSHQVMQIIIGQVLFKDNFFFSFRFNPNLISLVGVLCICSFGINYVLSVDYL